MGARKRSQKGQSFQFAAQSFAAFILIAVACSHNTTTVPPALQQALNAPEAPAMNVSSLGIQLTQQGENDSPSLSADGKKVVFVSRKRRAHSQGQIYIFDLDSLKEKRLTYQDGDCRDPIFLKDESQIVYASNTDELKEKPLLFRHEDKSTSWPPTELYRSDLSGSDIERLTKQPGFDGFPWPRWDRPQSLTYSSLNGAFLEARQLNIESKQSVLLLAKKDRSIESMRLSPDKKQWAWIERAASGEAQIWLAPFALKISQQKALPLPAGEYKEVLWFSESKLLFVAKLPQFKKYQQIYTYDLGTQCLQNLLDTNSDLSSPRPNPEKQGLVFVSSTSSNSDIFYKSIPASDKCVVMPVLGGDSGSGKTN
jgi:Tol biopolymer transport system component